MLAPSTSAAVTAAILQLSVSAGTLVPAAPQDPMPPGRETGQCLVVHDEVNAWTAKLGEAGVRVSPDSRGWSLGLRLVGLGFDGALWTFDRPLVRTVDGPRFSFTWSAGVDEWFVRRPEGIEHGFTLWTRPPGAECPAARLVIELGVEGDVQPRISASGRDVSFQIGGADVFNYTGLMVLDAQGRELSAHFETTEGGLRISVDERDAVYPLIVDPLLQRAYIKAISPDAGDRFGFAVAASGDLVAVGAPYEDGASAGLGGDPSSNAAPDAGAVYVYRRAANLWMFDAYLKASNAGGGDEFGFAVAMQDDLLVVGAPGEGSAAIGVGGNQADDSAPGAGAVYVFRRSGPAWSQEAYLKASNTGAGDGFGGSIDVDGDFIVAGASGEDSVTGADPFDDSVPDAGAAYAFEFDSGAWQAPAYLKANAPDRDDLFGDDVAIEGATVIVGAPREDGSSNMIGGNEADNSAFDAGAVYVFVGAPGPWTQTEYLKAFNAGPGDYFGESVAISGGVVAAGAPFEDSGVPGVNGNGADNGQFSSGAAYTFRQQGANWVQEAYVKSSDPGSFDRFGTVLDIEGGLLVVGAFGERSSATGINGSQSNNAAGSSGAAYLYTRAALPWLQVAFIKASNTQSLDSFGGAVDLGGDVLIVGASREDGGSSGVGGNQFSNSLADSGAAYAFDVFGGAITTYCSAQLNSTGVGAAIGSMGPPSAAANSLALTASSLPQNSFGFFLTSQVRDFVSMPAGSSGDLCLGGSIGRYVGPGQIQNSGGTGAFTLAIDLLAMPQPTGFVAAMGGEAWHFQAWYRDAIAGVPTSNFTNGLTVLVEP